MSHGFCSKWLLKALESTEVNNNFSVSSFPGKMWTKLDEIEKSNLSFSQCDVLADSFISAFPPKMLKTTLKCP